MAERGAAYIPIVSPAHNSPTNVIRVAPFKANRVIIITIPRNATFTAATNFTDFICHLKTTTSITIYVYVYDHQLRSFR